MRTPDGNMEFNNLRAHLSRCLLRQMCRSVVKNSTVLESTEEEDIVEDANDSQQIQRFHGALMFVDISGFTALSTKIDLESLNKHINDYFKDMLAIIDSFGGDVVKVCKLITNFIVTNIKLELFIDITIVTITNAYYYYYYPHYCCCCFIIIYIFFCVYYCYCNTF